MERKCCPSIPTTRSEASCLESLVFSICSWALGQEGSHSLHTFDTDCACHFLVRLHLPPCRSDVSTRSRDHTLVYCVSSPLQFLSVDQACTTILILGGSSLKDSVQWAEYQSSVCSFASWHEVCSSFLLDNSSRYSSTLVQQQCSLGSLVRRPRTSQSSGPIRVLTPRVVCFVTSLLPLLTRYWP